MININNQKLKTSRTNSFEINFTFIWFLHFFKILLQFLLFFSFDFIFCLSYRMLNVENYRADCCYEGYVDVVGVFLRFLLAWFAEFDEAIICIIHLLKVTMEDCHFMIFLAWRLGVHTYVDTQVFWESFIEFCWALFLTKQLQIQRQSFTVKSNSCSNRLINTKYFNFGIVTNSPGKLLDRRVSTGVFGLDEGLQSNVQTLNRILTRMKRLLLLCFPHQFHELKMKSHAQFYFNQLIR